MGIAHLLVSTTVPATPVDPPAPIAVEPAAPPDVLPAPAQPELLRGITENPYWATPDYLQTSDYNQAVIANPTQSQGDQDTQGQLAPVAEAPGRAALSGGPTYGTLGVVGEDQEYALRGNRISGHGVPGYTPHSQFVGAVSGMPPDSSVQVQGGLPGPSTQPTLNVYDPYAGYGH